VNCLAFGEFWCGCGFCGLLVLGQVIGGLRFKSLVVSVQQLHGVRTVVYVWHLDDLVQYCNTVYFAYNL